MLDAPEYRAFPEADVVLGVHRDRAPYWHVVRLVIDWQQVCTFTLLEDDQRYVTGAAMMRRPGTSMHHVWA